MLALIAAVPFETELLRKKLSACEVHTCGHREFLVGSLAGQAVALLHSGVGKTNAAAATEAILGKMSPRAVLNFGCGGAYPGSDLAVGDLALASEEVFGDEGAQAPGGFADLGDLGLPVLKKGGQSFFNRFPVDLALLAHARPTLERFARNHQRKLGFGSVVTVSTCSGTAPLGDEMVRRTGGICENMEGAAIAQICSLHDVCYLEVRGISNLVENRDLKRWDLKSGAEIAQQAVERLLREWPGPRKSE